MPLMYCAESNVLLCCVWCAACRSLRQMHGLPSRELLSILSQEDIPGCTKHGQCLVVTLHPQRCQDAILQ